jgi:hypothetical protein
MLNGRMAGRQTGETYLPGERLLHAEGLPTDVQRAQRTSAGAQVPAQRS